MNLQLLTSQAITRLTPEIRALVEYGCSEQTILGIVHSIITQKPQ
jgi:hypothetical protein